MTKRRSLGVVRISRLTDESTSLARQREVVLAASERVAGVVVAWAEDSDVSASKYPPTARPELRPWLTDPAKLVEYDEILFWRLDRFIRSVGDFADAIRWCDQHGKNLRSATEDFDLSTPMGRAMAYLIAIFAEMESRAISLRVSDAKAFLNRVGRFPGGRVPYGYRVADNPVGPGKVLVQHPPAVEVVERIVEHILNRGSVHEIVRQLNDKGVPTPLETQTGTSGYRWRTTTVTAILRSVSLLGQIRHRGHVVHGDDGLPVQRAQPILDLATWQRVQLMLDTNSHPPGERRKGANFLLGVLKCWECGGNRALQVDRSGRRYYRCAKGANKSTPCGAALVRADWVEAAIEDAFLTTWGQSQRREKRWVVGQGTPGDLEACISAYQALLERRGAASSPSVAALLDRQLTALEERIAELETRPVHQAHWEVVDTGETWGDAWKRSTWLERKEMLLKAGLLCRAGKQNGVFMLELMTEGSTLES